MPQYTIIGADAAGLSAAVQIKRTHPGASIRILNKGADISYGACGIPFVIGGNIEEIESLIHFTPDSFEKKRGMTVDVEKEVIELSPSSKELSIKDLRSGAVEKESFTNLLIATGAEPKRLPFLDYESEGVFCVHTIPDLRGIITYIERKRSQRAAVIGAGFIGLELCEALTRRGMQVTVLEALDSPIAAWPKTAKTAVMNEMTKRSVQFFLRTFVSDVQKTQQIFRLQTDERTLEADVIFSVVGTIPAVSFCGSQFDKLPNGALLVDTQGRTSVPDIYAAGDCVGVKHLLTGKPVYMPLGSTANKMGRIAGMNMAGKNVTFPGIVGTQIFKFFDLSLAKTGFSREEAEQEGWDAAAVSVTTPDRAGYYPGASPVRMEITFEKDSHRLLGALVVCRENAARFIDPAAVALTGRMTLEDLAWLDAAYTPPFAPVWNALMRAAFKGLNP